MSSMSWLGAPHSVSFLPPVALYLGISLFTAYVYGLVFPEHSQHRDWPFYVGIFSMLWPILLPLMILLSLSVGIPWLFGRMLVSLAVRGVKDRSQLQKNVARLLEGKTER